jgi:hypothetical protein
MNGGESLNHRFANLGVGDSRTAVTKKAVEDLWKVNPDVKVSAND